MKKRKKTKIKKSTLAVTAFLIFIAIMIVISILNNENTQTQTKPPAREYFEIFDIVALVKPSSENETIKIWQLDFKIKPIGGDAHDLVIIPPDDVQPEDWPNFEGKVIRKNETVIPSILFPSVVQSQRNENGSYPITLRIICDETGDLPDDQKVTIYITSWYPV
jgi:hypothetical protein